MSILRSETRFARPVSEANLKRDLRDSQSECSDPRARPCRCRATILAVSADPLKSALEEIAPKLDPDLGPVLAALQADEPVEHAWETLLKAILDEA